MGYATYNVLNGSRGTIGGLGASMLTGGVMSGAMYGVSSIGTRPSIPDIQYSPLNLGPLPTDKAATFRSSTYTGSVKPIVLHRSYGGAKAGELGPYWTNVKPHGPTQAMLDSALLPEWGNPALYTSSIRVPQGAQYYYGIAGPQGNMIGGGNQYYFHNFIIPDAWKIRNPFGFTWGPWKYW
jgi:hypothetical protein